MASPKYDYDVIVEKLKEGMTTAQLEAELGRQSPGRTPDQLELDRMNTIGWFRQLGHVIPRKRGFYQIVGFKTKAELQWSALWPARQREVIDWVESLQPVTSEDYHRLQERCRLLQDAASSPAHQISPGYILSYELANDRGYWDPDGLGIIVKKFDNQPRFRLVLPTPVVGQDEAWLRLLKGRCQYLGLASRRNIKLMSAAPGSRYSGWGFERDTTRVQGLYSLDSLASESFIQRLPSRKQAYVRKNQRELRMVSLAEMGEVTWFHDSDHVISTWRNGPPGLKQRQLAILRDYAAAQIAWKAIRETSFIFYRGDDPVGVIIYDPIGKNAVGDLVCKGLNYPSMPGGYHNTALTMLTMVAKPLMEQGFSYLNDGGLDGGTSGLYEYKKMIVGLSGNSSVIKTQDWYLPNSSYTPPEVASGTESAPVSDGSEETD